MDRDGVLNVDRVDYVYRMEDFIIPKGVPEASIALKEAGYLLVVITNQSGIAKGLYERKHVFAIHEAIQKACGGVLDDLYFCPYHENFDSRSLTRKPGSLLIEKAAANIRSTLIFHLWWGIMSGTSSRERELDLERYVWPLKVKKRTPLLWYVIY